MSYIDIIVSTGVVVCVLDFLRRYLSVCDDFIYDRIVGPPCNSFCQSKQCRVV